MLNITKAFYELQQASRTWNAKLDDTLKSIRFVKSKNDQGVYYLNSTQNKAIVEAIDDRLGFIMFVFGH